MNSASPATDRKLLIGGQLVGASSGRTFPVINPATEEVIGVVADADASDMQQAIDAARHAFEETRWASDRELRKRCLSQLQAALESERELYREELILEVGCPRQMTYGPQLDMPLKGALRHPIRLIDEFPWEEDLGRAVGMTGTTDERTVWREPVGVVGAITPWNVPLEVTLNKLGQALATGNTVVLKPAPDTPFNATRLARLAAGTELPAGVLNIVTSSDHLVGEELTLSPDVDLISFTGSTAVGQRIMEKGAATMKRLFLELGGKSATIVLEDADFSTALLIGMAACYHGGQGCATPTRMLLPRTRYDEGVAILKALYEKIPYGDPQRADVVMGPLISAKQRARVRGYIETGLREGATAAVGGIEPPDGLPTGYYVRPTVFVDVDPEMTIAQEEIFGPVLVTLPYEDEDDAVRIANGTRYGLASYVVSGSDERARALARRMRAGNCCVNGGSAYAPDIPFGGYKHSGVGRQNGRAGFEQYLETKAVAWPLR
ncbi:MAG TPA: aldehyde dehydrogenase family protein [Myxococcota bacterium]|nr:aldehyde dehydrogenase family protein [Myxococcota bacterium]